MKNDKTPDFGENRGCISLYEQARWSEWSRNRFDNPNKVMKIIGHENGVPDLYRTNAPAQVHQFCWCDPKDEVDLAIKRQQGYEFVNKTDWTKREDLWSWTDSGQLLCLGEWAMARSGEKYLAEVHKEAARVERNAQKEADDRIRAAAEMFGVPPEAFGVGTGATTTGGRPVLPLPFA